MLFDLYKLYKLNLSAPLSPRQIPERPDRIGDRLSKLRMRFLADPPVREDAFLGRFPLSKASEVFSEFRVAQIPCVELPDGYFLVAIVGFLG